MCCGGRWTSSTIHLLCLLIERKGSNNRGLMMAGGRDDDKLTIFGGRRGRGRQGADQQPVDIAPLFFNSPMNKKED